MRVKAKEGKSGTSKIELTKIGLTIIIIVMMATGWGVHYIFAFLSQYRLWPWEQKLIIVCDSASESGTYEVPWGHGGIKTWIPVTVQWHVSKPFNFLVQVKADRPRYKKPVTIDNIDTTDDNWASKKLRLPLSKVGGEYLRLNTSESGERRSFEIIVRADVPTPLQCRKKVNIFFVPWSHTIQLSETSIYTDSNLVCTVKITNKGAGGRFIVVYEAYRIKKGKQGPYVEGRIGFDKNGKNIVHVDNNEEIELRPESFIFKHEGEYIIKTYAIKYQEYLMQDWEFWGRGETEELTLDDVGAECEAEQILLWLYSDRHKLDKIHVINR